MHRLFQLLALFVAVTLTAANPPLHAQPGPVGSEFQVATNTAGCQNEADVATAPDGDFVVVWTSSGEVFGQQFSSDGTMFGSEFQVNSYTTNSQNYPRVAVDGNGDFVVSWQSFAQDGLDWSVQARRYASNGSPTAAEFQVNTYTVDQQRSPAVDFDSDGDFVVSWSSRGDQDGSGWSIHSQLYHSDGTENGGELQVNSYTTGEQFGSAVAFGGGGEFVVYWGSDGPDSSYGSVRGQRFGSDGSMLSGEFQVNTFTTDDQHYPAVAFDGSGNSVVFWESTFQDGSLDGVFGQRFGSDGSPAGGEFQANTFTTAGQNRPHVATDGNGHFVVVWQSYFQDGEQGSIHGQRFSSNGSAAGGEFQVNTYTTDNQSDPAVAAADSGDFVVVWTTRNQDGTPCSILGQRYSGPLPVELTSFEVD